MHDAEIPAKSRDYPRDQTGWRQALSHRHGLRSRYMGGRDRTVAAQTVSRYSGGRPSLPRTGCQVAAGEPKAISIHHNPVRQGTLLQTRYTPDCFDRRNRYMVDHSDLIIAVWNGSPSGTGNTISYAKLLEKRICVIPVHVCG